jgi:hypothetical protein
MDTLRALLIQRAARLQQRPAFRCEGWSLDYGQLRNRVEGLAMGLLATERPPGAATFLPGSSPWAWMAELAAACCGLRWDPAGDVIEDTLLGGPRFHDEGGRGPYHDRDKAMGPETPFTATLTHGELLLRLRRLNDRLGWDHETVLHLPTRALGTPGGRGALWSTLYAGASVQVDSAAPARGLRRWLQSAPAPFDPSAFLALGL